MPYSIRHSDDEWEVINSDTGHVVGTHPNEDKAKAHLRALYANVPDASKTEIVMTASQLISLIAHYTELCG